MTRNVWLALLICLNLALLGGIIFVTAPPRTAAAQTAGGLADNYLMVTGQIQSDYEALYVLDMKERMLHTFLFRRGTRDLDYAGYRLLEQDFRHNRSQP